MLPTRIKKENSALQITWEDGKQYSVPLTALRDKCPCAGCQGETILFRTFDPPAQPELPGKYELRNARQVGTYALGFEWGDGHATGIYTWEHLRTICEDRGVPGAV